MVYPLDFRHGKGGAEPPFHSSPLAGEGDHAPSSGAWWWGILLTSAARYLSRQRLTAHRTVAGAQLVGLQAVEDAQGFLRRTADIQAVDRDMLHDAVRIDDQGGAQRDIGVVVQHAQRAGE